MFNRVTFKTHRLPDFAGDGTAPHQPENSIMSGMTNNHRVFIIIELNNL